MLEHLTWTVNSVGPSLEPMATLFTTAVDQQAGYLRSWLSRNQAKTQPVDTKP